MKSQIDAPIYKPNFEKPGNPNSPTNKDTFLSKFEYDLWSKHIECFHQQMGTRHPMWCNKDAKLMKICTIILIGMMSLALKTLALAIIFQVTYLHLELFT